MTEDLEAIILSAGSAYSEGRFNEALECYEQAIAARPHNAILFANYAAILLRLDRVDEALKNADHAIELDPNWAKAYYRRGEALRRLNALLPAVVSLSEGVALDPSNKLIAEMQIDVSQQLFKHFPLERLQSMGLDHDRFTVLTVTGQELASAGYHREAQTVLNRALSLHTPSLRLRESALSSLASVHFLLGDFVQATHCYQQQLEIRLQLGGPPAEVLDNVAMSSEAAGNHALALRYRKQILEHLCGLPLAKERLKIAKLHSNLNQTEQALEEYECIEKSVLFMDDKDKEDLALQVRIGKGVVYGSMGETAKCLEELSNVNGTTEEDAILIADTIVACHIKEGNSDKAVEYLNSLLKTASERTQEKVFGHACFLLAREQIRNGHHISAARLAKRILRLAKVASDHYLERCGLQLLATIYEKQRDPNSTKALLKKFLEVPGATVQEHVNALLQLAVIAPETGDDAVKYLSQALEQAKNSENVDAIVITQSAMLRHYMCCSPDDERYCLSELLAEQKKLLRKDISAVSRSIIFEDLGMCEEGEPSGCNELRALEQSLTEAQEGNHVQRELFLLEKLGDTLLMLGRIAEAEGFYQQLLTLARQLREVIPIKRGFMKMAILTFENKQWNKSVEFAKNAITLARLCRDHESKAYMLLLTSRAELQRGNKDVSMNILQKTLAECERYELNNTLAIATRFMVDSAIECGQDDHQIREHLRQHISLFAWETDEGEKLRSVVRLPKYDSDLDHITSLTIIAAAKKITSAVSNHDRATILLDCFDACHHLDMRDESWRILEDLLEGSIPEKCFQKIAQRLVLFPLHRRAPPLLHMLKQGFSDSQFLVQLAVFMPSLILEKLPVNNLLLQLVCYVRMEDWRSASTCVIAALADEDSSQSSLLDGIFGHITTEEVLQQVFLLSQWYVEETIHCLTLHMINEIAFCSFFDLAFEECLHQRITLTPRSRAHLHGLISMGQYDLVHEAAQAVEKIICAANIGETELMPMWYEELVQEFLAEQVPVMELFSFSSLQFQLKVATVFMVLQQETFEEQLRIMETCKYLMDRRARAPTCNTLEEFRLISPSYQKSFVYIFKIGRIELAWSWEPSEGDELINTVNVETETLTFYESCLLQYLEKKRIPKCSLLERDVDVVIANGTVEIPTSARVYALHSSRDFEEQS
ncbi:unnamed protein product [Cylicocyclus nassatus]|uniref:Tetratricopeptide repeat protein n=1 Tax=Cylicocyclus nassatus TaxID=53992 RepID=A0AA36GVE0_CYLNA|nr:unnamed protein product [Cylicocyclus nassatus]